MNGERLTVKCLAERAQASLPSAEKPRNCSTLSPAEVEILRLVGLGLTNQEIADAAFISLLTVRTHLKRIYSKCAIEGRARLAIAAFTIFGGTNG